LKELLQHNHNNVGFRLFTGLLAEVFWGLPGDLRTAPRIISLSPLSLTTDVTDVTLGASGLWLGTRTGAGDIATLA
jgi:hypothetical protein